MNVFGYLRVSGKGQVDGDGFDRQRDTISRFCAAKGHRVLRWFSDGAVSGEVDTADREAFAQMMALAGDATSTTVVVERADRLGRTLAVCEIACEEARKSGVQILEAASDTDLTNSDDPTRVLIRQVLGCLAEWNKNVQVKRLRDARDRIRKRTGKCEGRKPSTSDEAISLVMTMRLRSMTFRQISSEMNRRHVPTAQGGRAWHPSTVAAICERMERQQNDERLVLRHTSPLTSGLAC